MALNTPYKRVDLNVNPNYASMAQKDPWFALGYALGEGYWNNYNARGEKKATETAEKMLEDYIKKGASDTKSAPQSLVDQAMTLSVGGNTVSEDSVKKASKGDGKGTIKPEVDHALLKWDYLSDKYQNSPNPVGDSIAAQNLVNNTELALSNADMGAFDVTQFKLALDKQLLADGRNTRQREAAWAAVQPMIASKKAEYNGQVVDQLYDLYRQAQANGDHANAEKFAIRIGQINPQMGKHLLGGTVTYKDRWQQENREKIAAIRASGKGSRGSNGSIIKAVSDKQYENAIKIRNDENSTPGQRTWADDVIQRYMDRPQGYDLDNADDVALLAMNLRNRVDRGEITYTEALHEAYEDGYVNSPYWEGVAEAAGFDYNVGSNTISNNESGDGVDVYRAENSGGELPKGNTVNPYDRTGFALAMQQGKTVKQWADEEYGKTKK